MARLQATASSRSTAKAPKPGRGEHFITSIVAFTQGPSITQVPLVTADQQILFAQMAHLSLGVTLTSCFEKPPGQDNRAEKLQSRFFRVFRVFRG
jgi:hypothetical protein